MDASRDSPAAAVPSTLSHFHAGCHQQGFAAGSSERELLNAVGSLLHQHQHDLLIVHQQQLDAFYQHQQDAFYEHQEFMHDKFKHFHDELNIVKRSVLQIKAQFEFYKVIYPMSMYACILFRILLAAMLFTGVSHCLVFLMEVFCNCCEQPEAGVKRAKIHSVVDQRRGVHGMLC